MGNFSISDNILIIESICGENLQPVTVYAVILIIVYTVQIHSLHNLTHHDDVPQFMEVYH